MLTPVINNRQISAEDKALDLFSMTNSSGCYNAETET